MLYFTIFFLVLASFTIGYIMGLVQKGVHIHHHTKNDLPKEYNESLVSHLPPEVQEYYHSTNGQNRF